MMREPIQTRRHSDRQARLTDNNTSDARICHVASGDQVSARAIMLIVLFGLVAAIVLGLRSWRLSPQSPLVVWIQPGALERVAWDDLDGRVASFVRQVQAGQVVGSSATEYQEALELAGEPEERASENVYWFSLAPGATFETTDCIPLMQVYVGRDSGNIERVAVYLQCL